MKYATPKDVLASTTTQISTKHAIKICREINRMKFKDAKKFMEDLVDERISIERKYYRKAAKEILNFLNSVEQNAKAKNLEPENMEVFISAHKGETTLRGRRKRSFGMRLKMSNLQISLKK
jgi:ribosomal protein L22